nr:uncharacterized protein LOC112491294 [Ziziphus jujuba var. spinosa]XP_048327856.1 uncharacterized protein LOC112491294 [Ziziphus jujuba var. spinosa]XP_048327857.1 uncharacterized protein LOC112491294 [Ziziphus jujuba var. spinosa]XP_048327858.1 uncharacterized protein LOC112491294 [Ziziphus jujuba var. spinosa]
MMYEKLQRLPNAQVSKKAGPLIFSFQAIEMKFQTSSPFSLENTGYQNCFEALIEKQANFAKKEAEALAMVESLYLPSFRGFYTQLLESFTKIKIAKSLQKQWYSGKF